MATRNEFLPDSLFKFDHLSSRVQNHLKKVYVSLAVSMLTAAAASFQYSSALWLSSRVQNHLKKVYVSLAVSMLTAAAGSYVHLFTNILSAGFLSTFGSIGLMIWLMSTRHSKETEAKRFGIFAGFTFLSGISLGPLLDYVIRIDPSIITTALMGTCLIFISFSLASLYNQNRTYLYMGGFLLSGLSWLCLAGLMNIFFQSRMIYDLNLYGGLLLFCGFVLYDTQLIIEKARLGDEDYIWHSVDLFLDFINIFRRLLIILAQKENGKKKRKD